MVHKKRGNSILGKKISNRLSYTIIAGFALILTGVLVWAFTGTPNPGHNIQSIGAPSGCTTGYFLRYDGGSSNWWSCAEASGGTGTLTGSGTTNYISKWTGTSSLGNSIIYDTGTNVGIGTTSPTSRLHVVGNTILTQNLTVDTSTLFVNSNTDRVGIRMTTPEATLDVNGSIRANMFYGDGSGLVNIKMIVTNSADNCNSTNQGLMRYRSSYCVSEGQQGSSLSVCMRTNLNNYAWYDIRTYAWINEDDCGDVPGICPDGEEYYECTNPAVPAGCYTHEPHFCYGHPLM
ncbi:hypothetical protein FJZ20_01965 [Candidatus Pacearchaeota archaeon]|nr:hypothetical protein [Candidatus Pacearchaeota archaeon]